MGEYYSHSIKKRYYFTFLLFRISRAKKTLGVSRKTTNQNKTKTETTTTTKVKHHLDLNDCEQWENQIFTPRINQIGSQTFHCANKKKDLGLFLYMLIWKKCVSFTKLSYINPLGKLIATDIIKEKSQ